MGWKPENLEETQGILEPDPGTLGVIHADDVLVCGSEAAVHFVEEAFRPVYALIITYGYELWVVTKINKGEYGL